jgi:hypothetical protein
MKDMRALVIGLVLAVLPALGQQPGAPIAPIALYTSFPQQQPPAAVLQALRDEVDFIMSDSGFRFEWRSLAGVRGDEVAVELAVLTFRGHCDVEVMAAARAGRQIGALGWTHVSDGTILPFSEVDCDGVRRFLSDALLTLRPPDRGIAYGRALGRVIAHELYHIFADTKHHGSCGVAKEAFSVSDLLSNDFHFLERESQALRTSKAHTNLENAVAGDSSR